MKNLGIKTVKARVITFSAKTATGEISVGRQKYLFDLTSFRSGRTMRLPASGQDVEAVISTDGKRLVSVWGD